MDRTDARTAAQAELDRMSSAEHPLQLVDEQYVADVGWAWVYDWNTARYYETDDIADAIGPGAGPIVVVKGSGETFALGSTPSYDEQLADYAKTHDHGETAPLGWG